MAKEGNLFLQRLDLVLQQRQLRDAMEVLNDETHDGDLAANNTLSMLNVFRDHLNTAVLALQDAGNDDQQIFQGLRRLTIQGLRETIHFWQEQLERLSQEGFVEEEDDVPAPAAAACSPERQTFCGGAGGENDDDVTECSVCLQEFVDGGFVSVMPCPSQHGHKFHPDCIARWLEMRNTCPLCRHGRNCCPLLMLDAYDQ